jgi:hypothetical protein
MEKVISRQKSKSKTKQDILESTVDKAIRLDSEIKERQEELKALKEVLLLEAEESGLREIAGAYGDAKISSIQTWDINTQLFLEWIKKHKKQDIIDALIKPSVDGIKKYLGETVLKEVGISTIKPYARISLKKR